MLIPFCCVLCGCRLDHKQKSAEEVDNEKDRDNSKDNRPSGISENKENGNADNNEGLVAVAHNIMVHYAKKDAQKRHRKKYKPKSGQYQLEASIKHFGDQGEISVTKELQQLNMHGVFEPKLADELTDNDEKKALTSLTFLKEKRNGDIKARSCVNGSKQRENIAKEEAAAPTVALESIFITAAIDAKENWKLVAIDIPGAFFACQQ
jgi:hypothetical protein